MGALTILSFIVPISKHHTIVVADSLVHLTVLIWKL